MQFSTLPPDYENRVYGGVLGKVTGVYLGRPIEQWSNEAIVKRFGEVSYYVNDQLGVPVVVADDDISGTFTFLRALEDNDYDPNLTAEQIGETWLNYIIEDRTVLWWGGRSTSTEHTAFLNLKRGIKAPMSGSIELNGKTVAEQIGSQIFIDGWGLIHPGDPEAAADWAKRAASVSHDGEAIYGAQVIASMIAMAFVESDVEKIQDAALAQIPKDCLIRRLIDDVREMVVKEPRWQQGFKELDRRYGYGVYTSNCHIVPNHGLIHFALLHGKGDFEKSMTVVNTCGWDTDCNAGNLGCLLGVRDPDQVDPLKEPKWYEPFGGRVIIPTADGGGYVSDTDKLTRQVIDAAEILRGTTETKSKPIAKLAPSEDASGKFGTPTFISPRDLKSDAYGIQASPNIYPGQEVIFTFTGKVPNSGRAYALAYGEADEVIERLGPTVNGSGQLRWLMEGPAAQPIFELGISSPGLNFGGSLQVSGVPNCEFKKSENAGPMWLKQWVNGLSILRDWDGMDCVQNDGTGLAIIGCRHWLNYRASAKITVEATKQTGLAVHVQGMRRFYALVLEPGKAVLMKARDGFHTLTETPFEWSFDEPHDFAIETETRGKEVQLKCYLDGNLLFDFTDQNRTLVEGAIGIVVTEGRARVPVVAIKPPEINPFACGAE